MSFRDRISEGVFETASGARFPFLFNDLSQEFDNQTSVHEFIGASGTFVQKRGRSGRRFPMDVFFSGPDYDIEANSFLTALAAPGVGRLEHPLYGVFNVIAIGTISRDDKIVTAANTGTVKVTFCETLLELYPQAAQSPRGFTVARLDESDAAALDALEGEFDADTAGAAVDFRQQLRNQAVAIEAAVRPLIAGSADVVREFDSVLASFEASAQSLVEPERNIAAQLLILTRVASEVADGARARVTALTELFGSDTPSTPNQLALIDFQNYTTVSAAVSTLAFAEYPTRTEAAQNAQSVVELFDQWVSWRESAAQSLDAIDASSSVGLLDIALAGALEYTRTLTASLRAERVIVLDAESPVIVLCSELYGRIDPDTLAFFETTNNLEGDELLTVPRGRQIVYYV